MCIRDSFFDSCAVAGTAESGDNRSAPIIQNMIAAPDKDSNLWCMAQLLCERGPPTGGPRRFGLEALLHVVEVDGADTSGHVQPDAAFDADRLQRDLLVAAAQKNVGARTDTHRT